MRDLLRRSASSTRLDWPILGIHQNVLHRKSNATEIQNHLDYVSAVFILANGSVPLSDNQAFDVWLAFELPPLISKVPRENATSLHPGTYRIVNPMFSPQRRRMEIQQTVISLSSQDRILEGNKRCAIETSLVCSSACAR